MVTVQWNSSHRFSHKYAVRLFIACGRTSHNPFNQANLQKKKKSKKKKKCSNHSPSWLSSCSRRCSSRQSWSHPSFIPISELGKCPPLGVLWVNDRSIFYLTQHTHTCLLNIERGHPDPTRFRRDKCQADWIAGPLGWDRLYAHQLGKGFRSAQRNTFWLT